MMETDPKPNTYAMMRRMAEERKAALRETLAECLAPERIGGREVLLEIGCGHGHWLAGYGRAHPETFCAGIDLRTKRIERANRKVEKQSLENVVFLKAEAREFLETMPACVRFSRVCILFPDPWPKARHHKKRLIQPGFLDALGGRVSGGGELYFRTDHDGYFAWAEAMLNAHSLWAIDLGAGWVHEEWPYFQDFMDAWRSLVARRRSEDIENENEDELDRQRESGESVDDAG